MLELFNPEEIDLVNSFANFSSIGILRTTTACFAYSTLINHIYYDCSNPYRLYNNQRYLKPKHYFYKGSFLKGSKLGFKKVPSYVNVFFRNTIGDTKQIREFNIKNKVFFSSVFIFLDLLVLFLIHLLFYYARLNTY